MAILTKFSSPSGRRVFLLVLCTIITMHFVISYFSNDYRPLKTFIGLGQQSLKQETPQALEVDHHSVLSANPVPTLMTDDTVAEPEPTAAASPAGPILANATFVMLCKNSELEGVISSVRQIEDRFNRFYRYPWVFLNDQPFSNEFKERVGILSEAPMHFGQIPEEEWKQPAWIDEEKALAGRQKMMSQGIIYAGSVPYRNMCRFNSGFFYRHELMKPYRYYWRVEPNVKYFCDLSYDPFRFMQDNKKVYGFTISLLEWMQTIPTLWEVTKEFVGLHYEYLHPDNMLDFLSNDNGTHYNLCHFWSNFEIADMDFWRGEAYSKFFDFLEAKGGFYYERWGDAPVHSIAVSLFASKHDIHFFNDIGYRHESFQHCPVGKVWYDGHCACNPRDTFMNHPHSCTKKFISLFPDNTTAT